jgi:eukaryotic-like serine/threonine-protein kinase
MQAEPTKRTVDIRRQIRRCPTCSQRFSRDAAFCPYDGAKLEAQAFDPLADPFVGTTVDARYELLEVLGEGGMGRVYKARHVALGRLFALKALRRELVSDETLTQRFLHEARATAMVKHPSVVEISDFGRMSDGTPYFVMELFSGETLGDVIKAGGPIPAGRAVRIVRQVAAALAAAHRAGVVHRDLKPDNIFLLGAQAGEVSDVSSPGAALKDGSSARVVDFGASKIIGVERMTQAGIVYGTPHYMSPEQASGAPVDHRADVYALGVIMYEMFTGRVPFMADTYMGVLTQHMFVQPVAPSQVSDAAKELGALEEITLKCLEKKPEDRFASMDALIEALECVVRVTDGRIEIAPRVGRWGSQPPIGVRYRMADELEPPSMDEVRIGIERAADPKGPRASALAWGIAFVVFAVSALLAAWMLHARGPAPEGGASTRSPPGGVGAPPTAGTIPPILPLPPAAPAVELSNVPSSTGAPTSAPPRMMSREPASAPGKLPPAKTPLRRPGAGSMDDIGDPFAPPK